MSVNDFVDIDIEKFEWNGNSYETVHKCFIADFSNVKPLPTGFEIEPIPTSKKFDETRGVRDTPIIIYGDTDSCQNDTLITTESNKLTIEDFYNRNKVNGSAGETLKGHESVNCKEKVLNYSKEKGLYYVPVKRIIRHKVTKAKWCLKTKSGKVIIVTNDHSMIVFRNGIQMEVKSCDILKTDKILCVNKMEYYLDDIESIECIGNFKDEYVYDIEVNDDTHTFIGNDILVHNSLYISFSPLMDSVGYDGDELKFILHMNGVYIKFLFKEMLEEYAAKYGVKNLHDFELETVNKSGLHIQKKHYINNVVWKDGVFFEDLTHFYPIGVEIVKSSTPAFVRENIWNFIKYLFKNPGNVNIKEILKILKDLKKQFMLADIEDISMTTSCSNYDQKIIDDQNNLEFVKGAHFSIKAAGLHNYLLNKNPKFKTRIDLLRGGKIKYYFCKHDMGERFAYMRSFHPTEITVKEGVEVDYDEQFAKTFLSIANRFIEPIGLPVINKRLSVLNSIFSSKVNSKKKKTNEQDEIDDDDELKVISSDDVVLEEVDELLVDEMYGENIDESKISEDEDSEDIYDDFWS